MFSNVADFYAIFFHLAVIFSDGEGFFINQIRHVYILLYIGYPIFRYSLSYFRVIKRWRQGEDCGKLQNKITPPKRGKNN